MRTSAMRHVLAAALCLLHITDADPFACPSPRRPVRAPFVGALTNGSTVIIVTPSTVFATENPNAINAFRCIIDAFVSPGNPNQLFVTYGSTANAGASVDTGCASLAVLGATATWAESLNASVCPLDMGTVSYPWGAAPSRLPACPTGGAPIPAALRGQANLTDPDASGDSFYLITETAWSTVYEGSQIDVLCPSQASTVAGGSATQIEFTNAGNGIPFACVWVAVSANGPTMLSYKWGTSGTPTVCPIDFTGALTVPFKPL